jgi:hypothetical protein
MRYLVVKGVAGFGDRLMTLGKAISLAMATGRILVIDWSDASWNHDQPAKGFWHYFDLVGLPTAIQVLRGDAATCSLLASLNTVPVAPKGYTGQLQRSDYLLDRATGRLCLDGAPVQLTANEIMTATEDVVVYLAYCSGRLEDVLPYLVFKTPMTREAPAKIGVHFRNTDKGNDLDAMLVQVKRVWRPGYSIYLATDDQAAVSVFRDIFGQDIRTSTPPPRPANGGGIHHCSAAELTAVGLTKEDLTHDMIRDVLHLRDTTVFMDCPNSLFSRIVTVLRGRGQRGLKASRG